MEHPENQPTVIAGAQYRFTVLTEQLIRMEYSPDGVFEDRPTSMVQSRSFPPVQCRVFRTDRGIQLRTACINLYYDEKPFSRGDCGQRTALPVRASFRRGIMGIRCRKTWGEQAGHWITWTGKWSWSREMRPG